jgi:hypothetical protein
LFQYIEMGYYLSQAFYYLDCLQLFAFDYPRSLSVNQF